MKAEERLSRRSIIAGFLEIYQDRCSYLRW